MTNVNKLKPFNTLTFNKNTFKHINVVLYKQIQLNLNL